MNTKDRKIERNACLLLSFRVANQKGIKYDFISNPDGESYWCVQTRENVKIKQINGSGILLEKV